jgi:hypothetical protein
MHIVEMTKINSKQQGAALLIMMLVLVMVAMSLMLSYLDGSSVKIERDKQAAQILAQAKDALIGSAISAAGNGERPGNFRIPDSFAVSETPFNYDGGSDSGCLNVTATNGRPLINGGVNMRCLGRFPWKDLGMHIQSPSENDPNGFMPWYAVSANLVDPTCFSVLNSNALNLSYTPTAPLDCSGAGLPYPWLTVRDGSGNVISNRVAAIIFIPNEPMGDQSRKPSPNLGMANQYLDTLIVPSECVQPCIAGNYSNADMDNDFITSPSTSDYAKKSNFNDKLLYITIDELMALVEKRVAQEASLQLRKYYLASSTNPLNRAYPDAASIGYVQGSSCIDGKNYGFLPFVRLACDGSKCQSDFSATVKFTSDKSYATSTGQCSFSSKVCTCTGAGSCVKTTSPARSFVCTKNGTCISNITGAFVYDLSAFSNLVGTGGCALANGVGTCSTKGSINPGSTCKNLDHTLFPEWFFNNEWKHFLYYAKGNLTVGNKSASSVLATTGADLTNNRPSNNVRDYLDNPNPLPNHGTTLFDAVGTKRATLYNDQMFIVSP